MNSTSSRGRRMSAAQAAQQNNRNRRGEYTEMVRGEAVVDVPDSGSGPAAVLSDALERYGLTVDDVPGLEEAWRERFTILGERRTSTVEEAAGAMLGGVDYGRLRGGPSLEIVGPDGLAESTTVTVANVDAVSDDDELVVQVYTRNGGGNREHYHDDGGYSFEAGCTACATDVMRDHPLHLDDEDSWDDPTCANFWFRVPAGHRAAMLSAVRTEQHARDRAAAQRLLDAVDAGKVPPWRIQASASEVDELERERLDMGRAVMPDWLREHTTAALADVALVRDVLEGRASVTGDGAVSRTLRIGDGSGAVSAYQAAEAGEKFREMDAKLTQLTRVEQAAHTADPVVREYLLGDVPVRKLSYTTGTGRNRRVVNTTTSPESDFRKALKDAKRDFGRAKEKYVEATKVLNSAESAHKRRAILDEEASAWLGREWPRRWWAAGWTGAPDRLPEPPEGARFDDNGWF